MLGKVTMHADGEEGRPKEQVVVLELVVVAHVVDEVAHLQHYAERHSIQIIGGVAFRHKPSTLECRPISR